MTALAPDSVHDNATDLLARVRQGDAAAKEALFARCYPDLKRFAHARLTATQRSGTLDTTSLVHEVFLKLAAMGAVAATSREHFMAYAASTMRSIIIDTVRARMADMRGGGAMHLALDTDLGDRLAKSEEHLLDVHGALEQLAEVDPRLVEVVEMRYFAGFTEQEIAVALGVTERTVRRDWQRARALLAAALAAD